MKRFVIISAIIVIIMIILVYLLGENGLIASLLGLLGFGVHGARKFSKVVELEKKQAQVEKDIDELDQDLDDLNQKGVEDLDPQDEIDYWKRQ